MPTSELDNEQTPAQEMLEVRVWRGEEQGRLESYRRCDKIKPCWMSSPKYSVCRPRIYPIDFPVAWAFVVPAQ